jgi:hypothetical protein
MTGDLVESYILSRGATPPSKCVHAAIAGAIADPQGVTDMKFPPSTGYSTD